MYKLTDKIFKDVIIVDQIFKQDDTIYFNKLLKIIRPYSNVIIDLYGIYNNFGPICETIIEEFGSTKIGEILYGKNN